MRRISLKAVAALCGSAFAAATMVPAASASLSLPSEPTGAIVHELLSSADAASGKSATDYWTPQRMQSAIPMDQLVSRDKKVSNAGKVTGELKRGNASSVPATPRASAVPGVPLPGSGQAWEDGGEVAKTAGRVFFKFDGQDASCSGNAVTSENGSTVMTAGHCVKLEGKWHTDWVFVPGYDNGEAPFGEWPAAKTLATEEWVKDEDINFDVGAGVVKPLDGQNLTDVVGGQGIAFNQERGQEMYAFGYPAAPPYDGEQLIYCNGDTFDDPLGPIMGSTAQGMPCDMTGGSSGGPWFLDFDPATGTGTQNSVVSYGYAFLPFLLFGPYFGDEAQALYESASGSTAETPQE